MTAPWVRLLTLLVGLLSGLLAGSGWHAPASVALLSAAAVGAIAVLLPRGWRWWGLVLAVALLGLARAESVRHVPNPATIDYYQGATVVVQGWLDEAPERRRGALRLYVRCEQLTATDQPARPVRGRLLLTLYGGANRLAYGDRVEAQGLVTSIPTNERFDYADFLARSDIFATLAGASVRRMGGATGNPVYGALVKTKARFLEGVRHALPEPQAALVLGIVLGYRSALPPELESGMVGTGLIHIVVISGLKATELIQTGVRVADGARRGARSDVLHHQVLESQAPLTDAARVV